MSDDKCRSSNDEGVPAVIFDLGGTVDIKKIRNLLGLEAEMPPVSALRSAPEYA